MSVGAKIEVVEDVMADLCKSLLEMCVQNMSPEEVIGLVGQKIGAGWQNMPLDRFNSQFALDIVPGTAEKPDSIFKKKEAIQIVQAIGQFASAAPITSMKVALRVLEQAFTTVVIKPEDWDLMEAEMSMQAQRGNSTGAPAPPQPGQNGPPSPGGPPGAAPKPPAGGPPGPGGPAPAGGGGAGIPPELANLPPQVKNQVMQMHAQGLPAEQIAQYLQEQVQTQAHQPQMPGSGPNQGQPGVGGMPQGPLPGRGPTRPTIQ